MSADGTPPATAAPAGATPANDRPADLDAAARAAELPLTVIRPPGRWTPIDFRVLWRYRELLYFFVWRDIKVRYKQTALGAAWAVLQPFFTMVVFSVFFGRLAEIPSDGAPYPIFSFAALVPWTFFSTGLTQSANSVVANRDLITKVYFPRLAIPTAAILAGLVDFAIAFTVLLGMMAYYGYAPSAQIVWIPALMLLALITALGVGYWLSALNVRYRDVRHAVPFLVQAWLFITPIAYPSSLLSEPWRTLYGINPMAGVVEGFRWALLGTDSAPPALVLTSATFAVLLLVSGAFYFRSVERAFADVV